MSSPRKTASRLSFFDSAPWAVWAVLFFFCVLLLLPYLSGQWRLADDSYEYMLPAWRFQSRVLALGQWPHWNLGEGFGKPTAVSAAAMFFYPPVPIWGWIVGWSETSYLYFTLLHLFAGAGLAFRFGRRVGFTSEAALVFAMAYSGNGFTLGLISNPQILFPFLFWPLLGEGLLDLRDRAPERRGIAKIAFALMLIETSGYPLSKVLIYLVTALAAWPLVRTSWKQLLSAGLIAILCAAPEWATGLRAMHLSDRMGTDIYSDIAYGSPTNFMALGTLLVPSAFLKRDVFQLGMVWLERSWWVGALTLGLAWAAFARGSLALARYGRFAVIALGGMLFAMGGHSFVRELASLVVPLLEHLRFANMGRMIPMAFLVFLGGAGLNALQREDAPARVGARKELKFLWLVLLPAFLIAELAVTDPDSQWVLGAFHTAFFLLLGYTIHALRWSLGPRLGWPALLVGVQFLCLADTGFAFRHLIAKESGTGLRPAETGFVPASPQPNIRSTKAWLDGEDWIHWDGNDKVFNAYTVPYHRWMKAVAADPRLGQYAASLASCHDQGAPGLVPELPGQHSCAGIRFTIDRYYGDTILISGGSRSPAWIMVHDFVDPDWHAKLNGSDVAIHPAFGVFKAIEVPTGQSWHIEFEYRHPWFPFLGWVSALGFVLLLGVGFRPRVIS